MEAETASFLPSIHISSFRLSKRTLIVFMDALCPAEKDSSQTPLQLSEAM